MDNFGAAMKPRYALAVVAVLIASAAPAKERLALDLPAGPLGDAIAVLGTQANVSISVASGALWRRPVPAMRGRMTVDAALGRLLRGSGAEAIALDGRSLRIAQQAPRKAPAAAPVTVVDDVPIIVTASKRDTRIEDFAGGVSLLDGPDLVFGGEQGMDSVLSRLASISSTHLGSGRNKLFIRGIADSSFTGPTQATVGQYLGDTRLTYNAPDPDLRLYDIQSVEVLEGPQGTLYGAGSLGGIIRVVPNAPRLDDVRAALSGGLTAISHGDPGADLSGMINLPLVEDRVGLRLVGFGVREGGYIDDVLRDRRDINRTRIAGGRATLRFEVGDGWTVDLGGVLQDNHGRDSQYADRDLPPLTRASHTDGGFDANYRLGQIVIGKSWNGISFRSSTGLVRQHLSERYDATLPGGPVRLFEQSNRTRMFSTESRLWRPTRNGFGWVLGARHTRNRTALARALTTLDIADEAFGLATPTTGVQNRVIETTVYGEASVMPLRGLPITAGARYAQARLSGEGEDVPLAIAIAGRAITAGRSERSFLPSASISTKVLPRTLLYARYQEGFRPGGLAIESQFVRRFRNDRVHTLEAGLRHGRRGRDRFDIAVSVSHTRWNDIQADFIDSSGLPSTDNIGDGRIWSTSASLGFRPVPALGIDLAVAYNNSRVVRPSLAFAAAIARNDAARIPNVARLPARIGADYRTRLADDLDLRVAGWARYVGKSRLGIGPVLGEDQGDYLDSALTLRIGQPRWGVTIGLTNLTDSIGNRFALGTPFTSGSAGHITPLRPRALRIGLDHAF
mgnify:CR=1 FL=1